jgi:Na+-driven multidrug efflux pump
MFSTFFQATGHGMLSMWQSLLRQLIGIIPIAWILLRSAGVMYIWYAWPLAEIIGLLFCVIAMKRLHDNDIKLLDKPESAD